ncbi:helix-turn-helix domain-containing protein [Desulfopila aestuarii]|uniref:Helix-turn-helix domain-containing protein n=1 Tax=Desulfopila aestuarii DSM 18488 TaxID=1121416 RepID=A0A1M7YJT9_9BACT|nr:helix-turn-helix domain-containing protein [Desulfopila aestuarii]SHO52880.1 Helix-turn-helix domain-containing protein [Desulfopila aestuarii DSM 18488]
MRTINPYKQFQGAFLPNAIMECLELSQSAKLMWARLAQYAGKDGRCFPSIEQLGDDIGLSRSAARKVLAELQEKGFILVKHAIGKDRLMHKTSEYFFLEHPVFHERKKVHSGEPEIGPSVECQKVHSGGPEIGPSLEGPKMDRPIEENQLRESDKNILCDCDHTSLQKTTSKSAPVGAERTQKAANFCTQSFDAFWDAFADKRGRTPAWNAWRKIKGLNRELAGKIIAGAKRYAEQRPVILARNGTPKMAQGWLNDRRWEDEGEAIAATAGPVMSKDLNDAFARVLEGCDGRV